MKIAEVSKMYGISSVTLRYYEKVGLIPAVNRDASGIRDYTETDLKRIEFVMCMRNAGLPVQILAEYMHLIMQGDETIGSRKEILVKQRESLLTKMNELQKSLDLLDYKINVYENALLKKEKEMVDDMEIAVERRI